MKVADLRQHLADLGKPMQGADADDLAGIAASLAPFQNMELRAFTALLELVTAKAAKAESAKNAKAEKTAEKAAKAEAAKVVKAKQAAEKAAKAEAVKAAKAERATKAEAEKKGAKAEVERLISEAGDLYDRGNDPSVTIEQIDDLMRRVQPLTVSVLKRIADRIGMIVSTKAKGDIIKKIRERLANRVVARVSVEIMTAR